MSGGHMITDVHYESVVSVFVWGILQWCWMTADFPTHQSLTEMSFHSSNLFRLSLHILHTWSGLWKSCHAWRLMGFVCVCCSDGDELKKSLSELADKNHHSHTKSISRISSSSNPFLDIAHDPNAAVYKTGFLARKIHADMDGKKSKI